MGKETKFLVIKNKDAKEIKYFEYKKIKGYNITPKKNVRFEDAINVDKMILINPSLIEKMVDKKVKRKFNYLINLMSIVCDSESSDSDGLYLAKNEAEKLRMELLNKYKKYIDEQKFELLEKKLSILEDELDLRLKYFDVENENRLEGKRR